MNTTQRNLFVVLSLCAAVSLPSLASAVAVSRQGTWERPLQGRDLDGNQATFEAYYDSAPDITWLADANYAGKTMNWVAANAASLNPSGSGTTDWRLPTATDSGTSAVTSPTQAPTVAAT